MKKAKLNSAVIDAVNLSTAQSEYIDNAIGYQLQVIDMENIYNKDRASLTKLLVENVALALTDKPSYVEWNYIHNLIRESICKSTGMEFDSFDKNIWKNITDRLESDFDLVKPKSPNVKSEQKSEQRAKIDAMSIDELKQAGKLVEVAKRQEKALKESEKLAKDDAKNFVKDFKTSMENLAKNEYDFAMYINSNINKIRSDFIASQS
jgi:CMP-N-acetylneuraminic acid synthetase